MRTSWQLVDLREWPTERDDLAVYGIDHIRKVGSHFADVLLQSGCNMEKAVQEESPEAKLLIKFRPVGAQARAWEDFANDPEYTQRFKNLLMVVEVVLVLPMSTAACERGFSAMKRVKTDWRSNLAVGILSKLLFMSIEDPPLQEFNAAVVVDKWVKDAERARRLM